MIYVGRDAPNTMNYQLLRIQLQKYASPPAAAALLASRKILKAIYLGKKKSYLSSAGSKITGFQRYFLAISRKQKELPEI